MPVRWPLFLALAVSALALASPAQGGVKDGVDAWSRGDFARAVGEWQKPAAAGDPDAQFNLAQAYKLGKGVPADLTRAEALYLKAAQQGHLQAADNYGLLLFQSGRREAAMAWLVPSADRGEPRAQYVLGIAFFNGDLVAQDRVRGYALMTRAAATGLETARTTLATMDATMPLEERQQGVALAAQLEEKATAARTTQLAALGLGNGRQGGKRGGQITTVPVPVPVPVPAAAVAPPSPATAGADFARPATLAPRAVTPAPTPARPVVPAATAGTWRVQLGAFGVAGNAQALWARLKGQGALSGRQAFYVPAGKLTKLQAGPFASRAEALAACGRLAGQACVPVGG